MEVVMLDVNNPYKRIGGGSLDQALFKKRRSPANSATTSTPSATENAPMTTSLPSKNQTLQEISNSQASDGMDISPTPKIPVEKGETSLLANQQTSKLANQQNNLLVNQQTSKEVNQQTSKLALSTKEKKKYGTYLREDSIMDIHIRAAQAGKKDHELIQDIVDLYFQNLRE